MLFALLAWAFIAFISIGTGLLAVDLVKKISHFKNQHFALHDVVLVGIVFQSLVLFYLYFLVPINQWFLFIFAVISAIPFYKNRKNLKTLFKPLEKIDAVEKILLLSIFLFILYKTAQATNWIDIGLYHLQAIRWMEEFSAVKGIGNLIFSLGLSSSIYPVYAMYSFKSIAGAPYHGLFSGFLFLWLLSGFLFSKERILYFLATIGFLIAFWNWESTPTPDIFSAFLSFYLIVKILKNDWHFGIVILLGVYLLTVKISALPLAFVILLYMIFKNYRAVFKPQFFTLIFTFSVLIILPWMLKNVYSTGYLFFPFTQIDVFNFEYKIPVLLVEKWTEGIGIFAKTPLLEWYNFKNLSVAEWLPIWFENQRIFHLFIYVVFIVFLVFHAFVRREYLFSFLMFLVVLIWQFYTPSFRFAVGLFIALPLFYITRNNLFYKNIKYAFVILILIMTFKSPYNLHLLMPQVYPEPDGCQTQLLPDFSVAGLCWYDCFPCSEYPDFNVIKMGKNPQDGYKYNSENPDYIIRMLNY